MTIKDLDGLFWCSGERPVVDSSGSDHGERGIVGPFPKDDGFGHVVTLHLLLGVQVEDLNLGSGAQSDDVLCGVHNGRFGCDGSTRDLSSVEQVDHGELRGLDAYDPFLGRHGGQSMFDGRFRHGECRELTRGEEERKKERRSVSESMNERAS